MEEGTPDGPGYDDLSGFEEARLTGGDGDNTMNTAGFSDRVVLVGGGGDDRLKGGSGNDVLIGGDGDDLLIGRDLLIGGSGVDKIVGSENDDLLIAGSTAFDRDDAALEAILAEWTSGRDHETRVANLNGTGSGPRLNGTILLLADGPAATVLDDGVVDVLTGDAGLDWFCNLDGDGVTRQKDRVTDLSDSEFAADLDFING